MEGTAVFISYRRSDAADAARSIYDALVKRIGAASTFMDVDNIQPGRDFGRHIKSILPKCRLVLVIIGPRWTKVRGALFGQRRLLDPHDWVRVEVELALASPGLSVVPVLVNGARMPRADEMPESLHPLLARNAAIIRSPKDIGGLLGSIALAVVPEMVRIPAGSFNMGAPEVEKRSVKTERPQHQVKLNAFELGKYPVTFAEWDAAVAAGATLTQPADQGWGRERRPVINVSWDDAWGYIRWLNSTSSGGYRLPSEAEWEYACRAGTTTAYSMGEVITLQQAQFRSGSTSPVGSFPANAFGLHDMHGNVREWCEDVWHNNYDGAPNDGSAWTEDGDTSERVLRGGSYLSHEADDVRSASRSGDFPDCRINNYGFRIARSV